MCRDPGPEPNEDEAGAIALGIQDCQAPPGKVAGVLDDATDVDWYFFDAEFPGGCQSGSNNPTLTVELDAPPDLRLCLHAECAADFPIMFTCPANAPAATSPNGVSGCCGAGSIKLDVNCQGTANEDMHVLVRLDQAPVDACVAYTFGYSFTQI